MDETCGVKITKGKAWNKGERNFATRDKKAKPELDIFSIYISTSINGTY